MTPKPTTKRQKRTAASANRLLGRDAECGCCALLTQKWLTEPGKRMRLVCSDCGSEYFITPQPQITATVMKAVPPIRGQPGG